MLTLGFVLFALGVVMVVGAAVYSTTTIARGMGFDKPIAPLFQAHIRAIVVMTIGSGISLIGVLMIVWEIANNLQT